jgi:hypothetical protein
MRLLFIQAGAKDEKEYQYPIGPYFPSINLYNLFQLI